jgi:hypothetical protein
MPVVVLGMFSLALAPARMAGPTAYSKGIALALRYFIGLFLATSNPLENSSPVVVLPVISDIPCCNAPSSTLGVLVHQ